MFDDVSVRCNQRCGAGQQADRRRGSPTVLGCAGHRVHEQHQTARDRRRAGRIEVPVREIRAALAQEDRDEREDEDADRDVDVEDPRPAEGARQRAAEQHARRGAAAGDRTPDAERNVPLASLVERRREDRECSGREHRGPEPLERTERDQRALRPGEAVEQGADSEEDEAGDEQPPSPEQVGQPAAEEKRPAEENGVGGDHPLEALLAEVQVGLDRRQRDVHDGDVEHDHELGGHDEGEDEPALTRIEGSHMQLQSLIRSTIHPSNDGTRYAYSHAHDDF